MDNLKLSIVISAYNRCDKLKLALEALAGQKNVKPEQFEVIVVDNNSVDKTHEVVTQYEENLPLRYVNETKQGLGHVRQLGYLLSRGEYVAYLDDDAIPNSEWVSHILEMTESNSYDCICGPIHPYYDTEKPMWFLDRYEIRSKGDEPRLLKNGEEGSGSNMIWKRSVLDQLGGVDVALGMKGQLIAGGEDADLFRRYWKGVGTKIFTGEIKYDPRLNVLHWTPEYKMHVNYILKRSFAAGIAAARMRRDYSGIKKIWTLFRLFGEMAFIVLRFPFMRPRYRYKENWLAEELRRLYLRIGWVIGILGVKFHPKM